MLECDLAGENVISKMYKIRLKLEGEGRRWHFDASNKSKKIK